MISVVIPVFNEAAAIEDDLRIIAQTMLAYGQPFEIIVVDDGSTDQSRQIVSQQPDVRLLKHPYNRGTGAALKTGIRAAAGDIIVMTDGDGTYPNRDIPKLLQYLGVYDMVVGARTSEQGTLKLLRVPAKTFIRSLASFMTGVRIPDLNSGMRAFRRREAEQFFQILPAGHSWVSTITMAYLSSDYAVKYVPIDYFPRKGKSSFHFIADTYGYLLLVVRVVMYFNPLKIFLPASFALVAIGIIKFIRDIIYYQNAFFIPGSTIVILLMGVQLAAIGLLADLIVKRGFPLSRRDYEQSPPMPSPEADGRAGRA